MPRKQKAAQSVRKETVERSTKIDMEVVRAHDKLERELKKLGVEIKPSFNLEPPLGRNPTRFHNRNG